MGYDFFRPHAALNGRTPAEATGIHVDGSDRVLTLLEGRGGVDCQLYLPLLYSRPSAAMYV